MDICKHICIAFNKVLKSLIRDIKDRNKEFKELLKQNYVSFDKKTDLYIKQFTEYLSPNFREHMCKSTFTTLLNDEIISDFQILIGIKIKDLKNDLTTDNDRNTLIYYLQILFIFNHLYNTLQDDTIENYNLVQTGTTTLFKTTLNLIGMLNKEEETDIDVFLEEIYDDDVKHILREIYMNRISLKNKVECDDEVLPSLDMEFISNTKIGSLAKEISDEIDISSLNITNPNDLLNADMFNPNSENPLGNIIKKVSDSIHSKIETGDINQEELMSEAFSLMNKLNTNMSGDTETNFMQQMMQQMMNSDTANMFPTQQSNRKTKKIKN